MPVSGSVEPDSIGVLQLRRCGLAAVAAIAWDSRSRVSDDKAIWGNYSYTIIA